MYLRERKRECVLGIDWEIVFNREIEAVCQYERDRLNVSKKRDIENVLD